MRITMYLVAAAWLYITLLMALAEATHANGTVLGAVITFVFYGVGPLALVLYLLNTPHRRQAIRAREAAQAQATQDVSTVESTSDSGQPDAGSLSTAASENGLIAPEREKP